MNDDDKDRWAVYAATGWLTLLILLFIAAVVSFVVE